MRVRVGGKEIDLLTVHDAQRAIRHALRNPDSELIRPEESGKTDANGNLLIPIYVVPAGMEFRPHVLNVEADGFTPALPFQGAGAYWQLRVASRVIDEGSLVAGAPSNIAFQIPFTRNYGQMQGGIAVNLEPLELNIVAGPINTLIRALVNGTLLPHPESKAAELS